MKLAKTTEQRPFLQFTMLATTSHLNYAWVVSTQRSPMYSYPQHSRPFQTTKPIQEQEERRVALSKPNLLPIWINLRNWSDIQTRCSIIQGPAVYSLRQLLCKRQEKTVPCSQIRATHLQSPFCCQLPLIT